MHLISLIGFRSGCTFALFRVYYNPVPWCWAIWAILLPRYVYYAYLGVEPYGSLTRGW